MFMFRNRSPIIIGLFQALGIGVYVLLVAWTVGSMESLMSGPSILSIALMLALLVFSAAVTGALVFGHAARLAIDRRFKAAIAVVVSTLVWLLVIILAVIIVTSVIM